MPIQNQRSTPLDLATARTARPSGRPRRSGSPIHPLAAGEALFVRLSPRALYQDVAERLREQIFNRVTLEPGSWIDEHEACRRVRHQPHADARGAQGAGRGRPW